MCAEYRQQYESLFDEYRARTYTNYSFQWKSTTSPISIDSSHFIYEGVLHSYSKELEKMDHFILTLDKLIACSSSRLGSNIRSNLRLGSVNYYLKLENPMLKKFTRDKRYGLRLVSNNMVQDFMCDSKEDMLKWFECFKLVSVQEHIEKSYILQEVIGSGSSATVRMGKRNDQEYAIKSISKRNYSEKRHSLVHLMNEIYYLRKLKMKNIIALHEIYEDEKFVHLVFEFMHGGELQVKVKDSKRLRECDAVNIMKQLLEAVEYCHSNKVVHRDIKPRNIILR